MEKVRKETLRSRGHDGNGEDGEELKGRRWGMSYDALNTTSMRSDQHVLLFPSPEKHNPDELATLFKAAIAEGTLQHALAARQEQEDGEYARQLQVQDDEDFAREVARATPQHALLAAANAVTLKTPAELIEELDTIWNVLEKLTYSAYPFKGYSVTQPHSGLLWGLNSCHFGALLKSTMAIRNVLAIPSAPECTNEHLTSLMRAFRTVVRENAYSNDNSYNLGFDLVLAFLGNCIHHGYNSNFRDQLRHLLTYAYPSQLYSSRVYLTSDGLGGHFGSGLQWLPVLTPVLQVERTAQIGCPAHRRNKDPIAVFLTISANTARTFQQNFERCCQKQFSSQESTCDHNSTCKERGETTVTEVKWPRAIAIRSNINYDTLQNAQVLTVPVYCSYSTTPIQYSLRAIVRQTPGHYITYSKTDKGEWTLDDDGYSYTDKLYFAFPDTIQGTNEYVLYERFNAS